ncbi:MAG: DMT family transporter [Weeksellaceae bacterium]|nr:DMT family transporter [Weeksellaceae bacterium]
MKSKVLLAHVLLFLANLFYGINYTVAKIPMPEYIQANGIVVLRIASAVIFFVLLTYLQPATRRQKVEKKDYALFILCGIFGIAANQLLFFKGLDYTHPISAAIIMTASPVVVLAAAYLIHKEKVTIRQSIGVILGLIGAWIMILHSSRMDITTYARNPVLGNILILLNAVFYAIYLVIARPLVRKYHPFVFMKWVFSIGLVMTIPWGLQDLQTASWALMDFRIWMAIVFILLFVSCFTYLFNTIGLQHLSPQIVGIYIYTQPIFAAVIAIWQGVDHLDTVKITGAAFVFVGVYLVSMKRKPPNLLRRNA